MQANPAVEEKLVLQVLFDMQHLVSPGASMHAYTQPVWPSLSLPSGRVRVDVVKDLLDTLKPFGHTGLITGKVYPCNFVVSLWNA